MSEWYDSPKHPSSNFRKSLLERIDKANPLNTLTAQEERRLSKLEAIVIKKMLKRYTHLKPIKKCLIVRSVKLIGFTI